MPTVHWLGQDDCHDTHFVGGKAASLSRLAALHTVPPGFAIAALDADHDHLADSTVDAIREAYCVLADRSGEPDVGVAVRSSAVDEDAPDASFAGQHDTYLNIRGQDDLLSAISRCRASARSEAALAYRQQQQLSVDSVKIAILVQQLVPSDVSAVVFSHNPLTKSADELMINATWGLGESLVSGTVTPDTYVINKQNMSVVSRHAARKERMTVMVPDGTHEVAVPKLLREEPSLTEAQALEIAEMATKLENATGHPVDVECAFAKGTLYLLQCRPITTL